jgi:hypothetical protein
MGQHPGTATIVAARSALLLLCALGLVLACARWGRRDVPPQGWWAERGPVVPHDSFPADCSLCHAGGDWNSIRADFAFDHAAETGVPLEGAHAAAECLRCHNDRGPVAQFARRGCAGCHEDVHRAQLGQNCESCHGQDDWRPQGQIAQHDQTRFPLVGAHAATPCWRCHEGAQVGNFSRADIECITCHRDDLATATNPDHQAQGWVDRCDRCHIPTSWTGGGFNHGTWPLTGQHAQASCSDCHAGGIYAGTPNQCVDCHLAEYNATTDPDHLATGIGTACQQCHGTSSWFGASFPHTGITSGCVTCHLDEYNNTTDPDHTAAGFPTSCESCHGTNTWFGANFSHSFPITTGKHKNFSCSDCHLNPTNYMQFSCTHCHEHAQAKMDDEHSEVAGYVWSSPACYSCHPNGQE